MQTKLLEEDVLAEARRLILEEDVPCVFVREGAVLRPGEGTGVRPLVRALDEEPELLRGSVVVDKIVGKAAAMLAVLGAAAGVYGLTMSAAARDYLAARGVPAEWETLAERIITVETPGNPRALPAAALRDAVAKVNPAVEAAESVAAAVDKALAMAGKEDVIVIFGSLSFLGEAEQAVQRGEKDHG